MRRLFTMSHTDDSSAIEVHTKVSEPDFIMEHGLVVFTASYHLARGSCCGSGCRFCPYEPAHVLGNTAVRP
ncbi:MAG: DUF5522 domain-containing protein [Planctomycetota bacterium]